MKPYFSIALALALAACSAQAPERSDIAPISSSLYSEFRSSDDEASFYGPFLAATLAHHDSRYAQAAHYYLDALKSDPESRFVADRAFFQLFYAGRGDDAAKLAVEMLGSPDATADALVGLIYVLEAYKREDWASVQKRLNQQPAIEFSFLITPIVKAWSFAGTGDQVQAEEALKPLLDDSRMRSFGLEHRAYILDYLGEHEAAKIAYRMIAESEQVSSFQPLVAYAHMLYRQGDTAGARQFLSDQTVRFNNNNFLVREGMRILGGHEPSHPAATPRGAVGGVFQSLGLEIARGQAPQAAVVYLRVASYLMPEVAENYLLLGDLLSKLDVPDAAASAYAAIPSTSPLRPSADLKRVGALLDAGERGIAEDMVRNALREAPTSATLQITLADILRENGDCAEAVVRYSQAIDTLRQPREQDWFVFFTRALCYEQLGDWNKTEADLKVALRLSPDQPDVLNHLGYSWVDRGKNIAEASALIEKAMEKRPDDGFITDSLGWVRFLAGDYNAAVTLLEQAVKLEPNDPTINHHLGDAYWRTGRRIEARFQWQHALDTGAGDKEKAELLEKLTLGLPGQS